MADWSPVQRQAIEARGCDLIVSAGAGSGKTSVLVERVVHCVMADPAVDINRLLVVTFTDAAAAQMRGRIRDRLQDLRDQLLAQADERAALRAQRQLELLDQAQISTLHAFCLLVVRRNFVTLGVDPACALLANDDSAVLRKMAMDDVFERRFASDRRAATLHMLRAFANGSPDKLQALVARIETFARSQPDPAAWLRSSAQQYAHATLQPFSELPWTPAFRSSLARQLRQAQALLGEAWQLAAGVAELAKYADDIELRLAGLAAALDELQDGNLAAVCACLQVPSATPRAAQHPAKEAVRSLRAKAIKLVDRVRLTGERGEADLQADLAALAPAVAELAEFTLQFLAACDSRKRQQRLLDFADLEHLALAALCDEATGEAVRLQGMFDEVFVDEYQDTSPIQEAIIERVARAGQNLFVVGDVKQSIYRFRMAEPELFLRRADRLERSAAGRAIFLQDNYRSRPEVVAAVNFVFQQLFCREFGGLDYARARMTSAAPYPPAPPLPVEIHLVERVDDLATSASVADDDSEWQSPADPFAADISAEPEAAATAAALGTPDIDPQDTDTQAPDADDRPPTAHELVAIEKEAAVIARRIQELMGGWPGCERMSVWDERAQHYRPLQYRDIAILLRSTKGRVNALLAVLRRCGIPAYGDTSSGFYHALEIRWLLAIVSVIDNPRRDVDLAAWLRSPAAGFSDPELALLRTASRGPLWEALQKTAGGALLQSTSVVAGEPSLRALAQNVTQRAGEFVRALSDWRSLARRSGAALLLQSVIEQTGLLWYVAAMKGGDVRRANVELLLDRARAFDLSSNDGIHGFVRLASDTTELRLDAGEARTLGENEDVVRILTIHRSKGLEYPVVFVADLGKKFYRPTVERAFTLDRELGFGPLRTDDNLRQRWSTLASIAIEEREWTQFLAEEARVLYVALTRARERLILVGSGSQIASAIARAARTLADAPPAASVTLPLQHRLAASTPLAWLLPCLLRHDDVRPAVEAIERASDAVDAPSGNFAGWRLPGDGSVFSLQLWNHPLGCPLPPLAQVAAPPPTACADTSGVAAATAATDAGRGGRAVADAVQGALAWQYADADQIGIPGKVSATDLRRLWTATTSPQRRDGGADSRRDQRRDDRRKARSAEHLLEDPAFVRAGGLTPRARGTVFHQAMRYIDLATAPTLAAVERELGRLRTQGWLSPDEWASLRPQTVVDFLASAVGLRLRAAVSIWREQPFVTRLAAAGVAVAAATADGAATGAAVAATDGAPSAFVVVQGVIDCLAQEADGGWLIVDYKTDRTDAAGAPRQAQEYVAQMAAYRQAVAAAFPGRNTEVRVFLYFVEAGVALSAAQLDAARLWQAVAALHEWPAAGRRGLGENV